MIDWLPVALGGIREYGRHRGVSHEAVRRAIESGRISVNENGQIDFEEADAAWAQNTRPQVSADGSAGSQYQTARTAWMTYRAKLAKLEWDRLSGQTLSQAEMEAAAFVKYRRFRDRILGIASRTAPLVAAESDVQKCYQILDAQVRQALEDTANSESSDGSPASHI